jgi:hypothetical protein
MPITITTDQAPSAKPVGVTVAATTAWVSIIECPNYIIPVTGFLSGTRTAPGVVEISSPLIASNVQATSATISARIVRAATATTLVVANDMVVEPNDMLIIPLNGQFLNTGDRLEIKAGAAGAINTTISYTVGQAEEDDVA